MDNYFGIIYPCTKCNSYDGRECVFSGVKCVRWKKWFSAIWPRTCKYLKTQMYNHTPVPREVWRYYSPDEAEAMRRENK